MIRKNELLNQVDVAKPCPANWDAMDGDASRRFCDQCQHHVHNLSEMTAAEAEALLANRSERLCVRYEKDASGAVLTRDRRPRRLGLFARMAFAVTALMAAFGFQQAPGQMQVEQGDVAAPRPSGKVQKLLGRIALPKKLQGELAVPMQTTGIVAPPHHPTKPPVKVVKKKVKKLVKSKPVVKAKPAVKPVVKPKPKPKP